MEVRVLADPASKSVLRQGALEDTIPFFDLDLMAHRSYLAAVDDGQIVGLVGFREESARESGALGVGFISTHSGHRRRGVAKLLVEQLFLHAARQGKSIALSGYEPDGQAWLKPLVAQMRLVHPQVRVFEND